MDFVFYSFSSWIFLDWRCYIGGLLRFVVLCVGFALWRRGGRLFHGVLLGVHHLTEGVIDLVQGCRSSSNFWRYTWGLKGFVWCCVGLEAPWNHGRWIFIFIYFPLGSFSIGGATVALLHRLKVVAGGAIAVLLLLLPGGVLRGKVPSVVV